MVTPASCQTCSSLAGSAEPNPLLEFEHAGMGHDIHEGRKIARRIVSSSLAIRKQLVVDTIQRLLLQHRDRDRIGPGGTMGDVMFTTCQ